MNANKHKQLGTIFGQALCLLQGPLDSEPEEIYSIFKNNKKSANKEHSSGLMSQKIQFCYIYTLDKEYKLFHVYLEESSIVSSGSYSQDCGFRIAAKVI